MPATTRVVPEDSPLLQDPGTRKLHSYRNGDVLVRLDGPVPENADGRPVTGGLHPPEDAATTLDRLRQEGVEHVQADEPFYGFVELAGPPDRSMIEQLEQTGLDLIAFEPPAAYLCLGARAQYQGAAGLAFIDAVLPRAKALKPTTELPESGETDIWIVAEAATSEATLTALRSIDGLEVTDASEMVSQRYLRVPVHATAAAIDKALEVTGVAAAEPRVTTEPEDEVADLVVANMLDSAGRPVGTYLRWLEDLDIDGAGVTIGIVDAGIDEAHDAFQGRIVAKDGGRRDWHGTFVAGHAAGDYRDERGPNGYIYGIGVAPRADLISQTYKTGSDSDNARETVSTAGASAGGNGSIQNNSWGRGTASNGMDYRSGEATVDRLVRDADGQGTPLTVCFSSGNRGAAGLTRPKAAKNAIVTGNSESFRPEFAESKPHAAAEADDIDDVYTGTGASSHGNCADGRIRPHVVAPGEWTAAANFDSYPGDREYISEKLTWGGGSSGATPKTAGACALITSWWRKNIGGKDPSPALHRAAIVNAATDTGFGGPAPNNRQGWGRLNIGRVFDDTVHKTFLDQTIMLREVGDARTWSMQVSDRTKPVRVTLAWTDPPGSAGTGTGSRSALINELELTVSVAGRTYHANTFDNGWSRAGSPAASAAPDNLQNVFLAAGNVGGAFEVTVRAKGLAMNCVTNRASPPQQDFALVVHNAHLDQSRTPYDLSLVIDPGASDGGDPDDLWSDGSNDAADDGDDRWGDGGQRPTLCRGDRGSDVRDLQELLAQLDYVADGIDGIFGPATRAAVRRFQRDHDLSDDGFVGPKTWEALDAALPDADGGNPPPDDSWQDVGDDPDGWSDWATWDSWDDEDPEATRAGASATPPAWLMYALAMGTVGTARAGGRLVLPALDRSEKLHITDADGDVSDIGDRIARDGIGAIGPALSRLLAQWDRFGGAVDGRVRARTAAVVVGAGSRFRPGDLVAMRRLARLGQLVVISENRGVLAWLAQRLQLGAGVRYRQLVGRGDVDGGLVDIMAEAAGFARAATPRESAESARGRPLRAHLNVTEQDQRVVVLVRAEDTGGVRIARPGGGFQSLTSRSRSPGIRVKQIDTTLQRLTLEPSANHAWAGTWQIDVSVSDDASVRPSVQAYVSGELVVSVETRPNVAGNDTRSETRRAHGRIATVTTEANSLVAARLRPVSWSEAERGTVELAPQPNRVLRRDRETTSEDTLTRQAGEQLTGQMRAPRGGPDVLDLQVDIQGVTPEGHRFLRTSRTNVVDVLSRSEWRRQRGRRRDNWQVIRARVTEVLFDREAQINGIVLMRDGRQRAFRIADERLRQLLRGVDLADGEFLFGIDGDVVRSVVDPLRVR